MVNTFFLQFEVIASLLSFDTSVMVAKKETLSSVYVNVVQQKSRDKMFMLTSSNKDRRKFIKKKKWFFFERFLLLDVSINTFVARLLLRNMSINRALI